MTRQLDPAHLPTPFTAAEIRDGCPPGRTIRLLVEPAGGEAHIRINRFVEATEEGAIQEAWTETIDGERLGDPTSARTAWVEFQAHASFPADRTTRSEEAIDTPLGHLECVRYTVRGDDGTADFWFDLTRPGMPVRYATRGDAGTTTVTMIGDRND